MVGTQMQHTPYQPLHRDLPFATSAPSASTSIQALSHLALERTNGIKIQQDKPRTLLPAPGPTTVGKGASDTSASLSPPITATQPDLATKPKQVRKRGRKRIQEDVETNEAGDGLDADAKRKLQNRAAQRAFRERKEKHVVELEERANQQERELKECRDLIAQLRRENEALRRGENPPVTAGAGVGTDTSNATSPADVKPVLEHKHSANRGPMPSVHRILNDLNSEAPPPSDAFVSNPHAYSLPPSCDPDAIMRSEPGSAEASSSLTATPSTLDLDLNPSFDFDAPFDFSESMALPPLFASLLDDMTVAPPATTTNDSSAVRFDASANTVSESLGSVQSATTPVRPDEENGLEEELNNDDDDPPPLPLGRIPCDKPECDFTAVSCALPIPWRPPNAPLGSEDKDLWIAQKCWAKLVSHPLFEKCDADELCQELRDKTRCSDDGRLVCHKNDVCAIFRNIPHKAKLRQMLQNEMQ
ncbi:uncharacterized protein JCM15063_005954 [Sporobolomyces koalae]|uniref:uncharacterized protein n=1 Tax=Sporobolomyces koalae TaxID=500713 RepID=UPI0031773302